MLSVYVELQFPYPPPRSRELIRKYLYLFVFLNTQEGPLWHEGCCIQAPRATVLKRQTSTRGSLAKA
jgi:hypothetical protein